MADETTCKKCQSREARYMSNFCSYQCESLSRMNAFHSARMHAAATIAGSMSTSGGYSNWDDLAKDAVKAADSLLSELDNESLVKGEPSSESCERLLAANNERRTGIKPA